MNVKRLRETPHHSSLPASHGWSAIFFTALAVVSGLFLQIPAWSLKNKISGEDQLLPTATNTPGTHCRTLTDYDSTWATTSRGSAPSSWPAPEREEIFWNLDIQSQDQECPYPLEGRKDGSTKKVGTENAGPLDLSASTCTAWPSIKPKRRATGGF